MRKMSGWQKAGVIAGVGCFSIIAICAIGIAIAVVWARSTLASLGDPTPRRVERSIALAQESTAAPTDGATSAVAASSSPLRLDINLADGSFTVVPGPPGGDVKVEGTYAEGLYELTQNTTTEGEGRRTTIRFRSKAPAWARMLGGMGGDRSTRPELTLSVPEGVPIDLSLRIAMGESRVDLGGLALGQLELDLSMGNHEVDFGKPVTGEMRRLQLSARMGNVRLEHMGNARAKAVETSGSMGNVRADLGGVWLPGADAEASFTHSMGELTVNVPRTVRLNADLRNEQASSENRTIQDEEPADPNAPRVRVRVSTSMGEGRIVRY